MKLAGTSIVWMARAFLMLCVVAGLSTAVPTPTSTDCPLEARDLNLLSLKPRGIQQSLCRRVSPDRGKKGKGILGKLKNLTLGKKGKGKASSSTNLVHSPSSSSSSHTMEWANKPPPSPARSPSWPYSPTHVREPITPVPRGSEPTTPGPMPRETPPTITPVSRGSQPTTPVSMPQETPPTKGKLKGAWKSMKKFF